MLTLKNLSVSLAKRPVLADITAQAPAGKVTAIIGPNGSGKSTLLRAVSGDLPYRGTIAINGRDCAELRPHELAACRSVLPQSASLAFPFTVAEVVRLGLMSGRRGAGADLVERALDEVDLSGFGGKLYQELSGGQQARVQLARVRAQIWEPVADGVPRWLLLDEPVASLDIAHQIAVMRMIRRFADAGGGVVLVVHDLNLAAMVADIVWLMKDGRILQAGASDTVICGPQLAFAYGCPLEANRLPGAWATFVLPQVLWPEAPRIRTAEAVSEAH